MFGNWRIFVSRHTSMNINCSVCIKRSYRRYRGTNEPIALFLVEWGKTIGRAGRRSLITSLIKSEWLRFHFYFINCKWSLFVRFSMEFCAEVNPRRHLGKKIVGLPNGWLTSLLIHARYIQMGRCFPTVSYVGMVGWRQVDLRGMPFDNTPLDKRFYGRAITPE